MQQNTLAYWALLLFSNGVALAIPGFSSPLARCAVALVVYICLFAAAEIVDYLVCPVWDQTERTTSCYDWFEQYLPKQYDADFKMDYVESLFDGDYSLTIQEATLKKYRYIFDKLELEAGMRLLDLGCGAGTWMLFCKEQGVQVTGITLSAEQARQVKMKGLGVRVGDYREPIGVFENAFDRVTVFGSTEHNCSSRVRHMGVKVYRERCNDLRARLFALVRSYLRPGGKMFVATLVRNENYALTPLDHCQAYVMDRFYGGRYSHFSEYTRALLRAGFDIDDIKDTTADYHFSAIADADYFGCFKIKWHEDTANKLGWVWRSVALDPFWVHKWLYYCCDTWQWQFGSSCKTSEPLTAAEVRGRAIAQNKHYLCSIP